MVRLIVCTKLMIGLMIKWIWILQITNGTERRPTMGKHYCELCWGVADSCPNDEDQDFEELLDQKLDDADFMNDLERERNDE